MSKTEEIKAYSDEEIIKKYLQTNDIQLLGNLLEKYIRFVFLVCLKFLKNEDEAKDMSMQVFEKVTKDIKRFGIDNFKSWLHVVAKNECLMYLRSSKGKITISIASEKDGFPFMEKDENMHHNVIIEKEENLLKLEEALNSLDYEQKQCITLFFLEERSYKEVCELTGYSMNEVKSYIQNGKRNLKNLLLTKGDILLYLFLYLQLMNIEIF